MEVFCGRCGAVNRSDRIFCLRCQRRLFPSTAQDLSLDDFVYPGERMNISMIEDAGWILDLFGSQKIQENQATFRTQLSRVAFRPRPLGALDMCMRRCGDELGLGVFPEAYVVPAPVVNAAVLGDETTATFMITQFALEVMTDAELAMIVGHEFAHIKSRHMLYHTAAESISTGGSLLASYFGASIVALPLKMSLLAWHRESEVTADRAALLMSGNIGVLESVLTKTLLHNGEQTNSGAISGLFSTHPDYARRLSLGREFLSSPEFTRGREKLRKRRELAAAPVCKHCGRPTQKFAKYCGACGRTL